MADHIQIINSRQMLKRVRGGRDGLYPFLENNTWDTVRHFDDFLGDEIQGSGATPGMYEVITGVDGDVHILADQPNGVAELQASVGVGASAEYCGLSLPGLAFTGNRNAVIAARINLDAVTTVKCEVGFTDVTTDAGAVNVLATPTANAADAAVWVMDTNDDANWQGVGIQAGTIATKLEPATGPTAATFETLIVALLDTTVYFARLNANGALVYGPTAVVNGITAATALVPWIFVQLRGAVDRNVRIDFIDVRARRTVS